MEVVCAFISVDAPDGRYKRLKIFAAASDFEELEVVDYESILASTPKRMLARSSESDDDGEVIE